ncbi:MAG: 2,3-bisphosphoglycerate-independent phosphoglycerate mutase [Candidatus Micrarchaeota archaeon]
MKKVILLIIDGLGDLPTPKTPLQTAKIPNLHRLAKNGITGMLSPIDRFIIPGSDTAHLNILGYDPTVFYCGRGPFEALGLGIKLKEGDVAFRANFGTVEGGRVIDRRAGRVDSETATSLVKYLPTKIDGIEVIFKTSVEHRGVLVLRGSGLSSNVSATDPHILGPIEECQPTDESPEAKRTAAIINKFTKMSIAALSSAPENQNRAKKANAILLRGAGHYIPAPSFYERFNLLGACVAGGALYRGVASFMGMDVIMVTGDTGDKNTDLRAKATATAKAIQNYDFVFMHVKMCDSFGHDGDFEGKKKALEKIDQIIPILEKTGASIIVTGDHSTPVSLKAHSSHAVPILVYGGERYDTIRKFDEISCASGGLGQIKGHDMINLILSITGKAQKYGS